jgi:(R,R)-butanediol dehydrogenase/meso-butanediol dehydrogenase/diacetyl reductase
MPTMLSKQSKPQWKELYKGVKYVKAAVWYAKEDIRIEDVPEPQLKAGEVKVKIKLCGICGSDLHEFRSGPFIIPRKPHPLTGRSGGPVILGHEFSADVVESTKGAEDYRPGDRVVANPLIYCGKCHYCKTGQHIMCTKLGTFGFAADGAFAEYAVFPAASLLKLPDAVSDEMGAFVEPLAVALHAVNRSGMVLGDTAAVVGAGPIGLLVMQACKAAGARQVFVIEPMTSRRLLAQKLGASAVFDPDTDNPGNAIADLTDGLRADVAFDCVGIQASFDTALRITGRRAAICIVGLSLKPVQVPFIRLWGHEKTLTFSSGYEKEFSTAIALLADSRVATDSMITARIGLDALVAEGMRALIHEAEKHIKILVSPSQQR